MPGNGIRDKVHTSFDEENFPQGQHHLKAVDKNWPRLSNNISVESQTQNGIPLIPYLKNSGVPQLANIDSGHRIPSFQAVNGLDGAQTNLRSEVARNQFHNQQTSQNGFMEGHTAMRHYEVNPLGMDANNYHNTVPSKGLSFPDSYHRSGTDIQKKDFLRSSNVQPSASFNSFGGQDQMGGQHPSLLQSLQRQQSGISDMQLLQQQMLLRQLQDNQRQMFQHQGAWQQNPPMNLLSPMTNQAATNHSSAVFNGIHAHDSSNRQWPQLLANNSNKQYVGASAPTQRSSEQRQTFHSMGLALQQCDQSLYGVPISGSQENPCQTQTQRENHTVHQRSSFGNSFSRNQHAASSDHDTMDGSLVSRQEFPVKPDLSSVPNTAPEKVSSAAAHSQNASALDPTEEKILFGSDDNLWEAFGGEMNTGFGGLNMSEGSSLFGGVPSLQSGSWSALMQSALAETSSVATGQQEEWSGLGFRSTEPTNIPQKPATFNYGVQQGQPSVGGESSALAASSFDGVLGHQLDHRASHERIEKLQTHSSSSRYVQDCSERIRHSEPSLLTKPSTNSIQICGKTDNVSTEGRKQHGSGSWTHQGSMASYGACAQLNDRADGTDMIGSRSSCEDIDLKSHVSEMMLHSSQSGHRNEWTHDIYGATAGKTDTSNSLAVGSDRFESPGSNTPQTSNVDANSGNSKAFESAHWLQNNRSPNLWRQVDFPENTDISDGRGKSYHVDKGSNAKSKDNRDVLEWQNTSKRENSSTYPSNASCHTSSGLLQGNANTHNSRSHILHGSKENCSGLDADKHFRVPKFQYHPMGDLNADIDNSCGSKSDVHLQAASKQVFNKIFPSSGSGGGLSVNKSSPPSQNMLELLHKLDQSKERESASHFSSSDRKDTYEAETSDGSVGQLQQNQFPGSQSFGLQLGPPSQRIQKPEHARTPSSHVSSDRSDMGHRPFISTAPSQSLSSWKDTNEGENRNYVIGASEHIVDKSSMDSSSEFPFLRSFPSQCDVGRALPSLSVDPTVQRIPSHSRMLENTSEGILPTVSALPSVPDLSACVSKGSNASVAGAQRGILPFAGSLSPSSSVLEAGPMFCPSLIPNVPQLPVFSRGLPTMTAGSCTPDLLKPSVQSSDKDFQKDVGAAVELSGSVRLKLPESTKNVEEAQSTLPEKVSSPNHVSDTSLPGSVPNNILHQSYSLLHQMQAMKSADVDPFNQTLERLKGPDDGVNLEKSPFGGNHLSDGHSGTAGEAHYTGPQVDRKVFKLSDKSGENYEASSASLDMEPLRRTGSSHSFNNSEASLRHEHSKITRSWAGQPGTLINHQAAQVLDVQKMAALQHMEQAKVVQNPADSLLFEPAKQLHADSGNIPAKAIYNWLPTSTRTDMSSPNSLPPEVTDQSLVAEQKKRKVPETVVQAWHKEVMSSARLHGVRTTEIEWARATNLLVQKMEDGIETNEYGLPSQRPKRRLILTSQLMQQLLRPPPAPFLAGDGRSQYENVTYCVNKSAVGDACRAVHFSYDSHSMASDSEKILVEEMKVQESTVDITKSVEDLLGRTKKLGNELSRLEQRSAIVDLRLELVDLEKISIINRLAKFHLRSQSDGSGPPPFNPFSYPSRPMPQKNVVAMPTPTPTPTHLPDSAQCLSL
ncbi:hypothetical protein SAY86_021643 [Trapa natans]|uniref:Uncharacterized protein n=1 Tax=Trapa natans TaxID=22666 RepID=A0AAN7MUI7_TRANT|nr:hypothetical protein SAY86_021643 [Trapa natans]